MFDAETLKKIYAPLGVLIPIGNEKAPIGKDWQNATDFHASMFTTGRFGLRPHAGLVIVDIDLKASVNGFETIENLGLDLPATLTQATPSGGQHRWYRVPQDASLPNAVNIFDGIDLRVPHKGQCLVYPTTGYQWLDLEIDEGETPTLDLIAKLPNEFIQQLHAQNPFKDPTRFNAALSVFDGVATGSRNDNLASVAGVLRKKGQSAESINKALQAVNLAICEPPLFASEVTGIAKSIARYAPEPLADISAFMTKISSEQALLMQQKPNAARFTLTHCRDLLNEPKPVKWLIKGVLMADTIALLYGDPASGKSLVAIDWAANIVNGDAWLGNRSELGTAVILAGEGHHGLSRRLKAWELANQQIEGNLFVSSTGTNLDTYQGFTEVVTAIDSLQYQPSVIVVDTLHRNFAGDENSAKDIGALINNLDALRHRYTCTLLIVHHSGNGEKGRARGSSSLKAAVDTSYRLDTNNGIRSLVCDKSKDFRPTETINFDLTEVRLGWFDDDGIEETSVVLTPTDTKPMPKQARLSGANLLAFETFLDAGNGDPVHVNEWRELFYQKHTGDSPESKKKAFSRARKDLTETGVFSVDNDTYTIHQLGSVYGDLTGHIGGYLIQKQMNSLAKGHGDIGGHLGDIVPDIEGN